MPHFAITPDSMRVLFISDKEKDEVFELYSTPIAGGPVTKLSGTLTDQGDVSYFQFAVSGRAIFIANKEAADQFEVFSAKLAGPMLDIDGNGIVDPLTDGLLLMRWQLGLRGDSLVADAIGTGATRGTAALVEQYLKSLELIPEPN